jgi:hypothetical protein
MFMPTLLSNVSNMAALQHFEVGAELFRPIFDPQILYDSSAVIFCVIVSYKITTW